MNKINENNIIEEFENGLGEKVAPAINEYIKNIDPSLPFGFKMFDGNIKIVNDDMILFIKWIYAMYNNGFDVYEILKRTDKYGIRTAKVKDRETN